MSDADSASALGVLLTLAAMAAGYLLPALIAFLRSRKSKRAILLINVLIGWTVIGWAVAFAWAIFGRHESQEEAVKPERSEPDLSEVVAIDVETTGLKAKTDRVVELALACVADDGKVIWTWHSLFDPERPIPSGSSAIHGIGDEHVKRAPTFAQKADEIAARLDKKILLAHNLKFDVGFLNEEFRRCGRNLPATLGIDTLKISRQVDRGEGSHRLGDACRRYGIRLNNAHQATDDATAAAKLFVAMRRRHRGKPRQFAPQRLA